MKKRSNVRTIHPLVPRKPTRIITHRIAQISERRWLAQGIQTKQTEGVHRFAFELPGVNPHKKSLARQDSQQVQRIAVAAIHAISAFEPYRGNLADAKQYYARRTADQIIRSRKILVGNEEVRRQGFNVEGCQDYSTALVAVLRARSIPCVFLRANDHSFVYFFTGREWLKADPPSEKIERLPAHVAKRLPKGEEKITQEKHFGLGLDGWDIGIRGLNDFYKYYVARERARANGK
ncbi:transglutaminase domain-containing protein [Candidatus Micrarchaeota archaeon]|nr:transglutaminase domain-containing protein [Candidatus Micrarchaeota archaeon]MBU1930485.1 transglutaminase domain-containing protein [Candidatus Micrarchaeota archaeon]